MEFLDLRPVGMAKATALEAGTATASVTMMDQDSRETKVAALVATPVGHKAAVRFQIPFCSVKFFPSTPRKPGRRDSKDASNSIRSFARTARSKSCASRT